MNRAICILLALSMFVPALVPTAAAQTGGEPPVEVEPPVDPEPPEPSLDDQQLGTYFEDGFEDFSAFTPQRQPSDRTGQLLWQITPLGREGSSAAALTSPTGLPRGMHQSLISDTVDLTPVPSQEDDGTADRAAEIGANTGDTTARGSVATASSGGGTLLPAEVDRFASQEALQAGTVSLPQGPAYMTIVHRFAFDGTTNDEGAVSGFTVEAKGADGEWVPVEPTAVARAARGTDAPSVRQATGEEARDQTNLRSVDPCLPVDATNDVLNTLLSSVLVGPGVEAPCGLSPVLVESPPGTNEALFDVGESVSLEPASKETNSSVPSLPNAYIAPLDARGFTGTTGDEDEDGRPDTVAHIFDLSPWSGEKMQLRFRAGTSQVAEVPDGLWAIDRVQVRAGARTADLRLQLDAPSKEHAAVPGQSFPLQATVQNVGLTEQQGPFDINITVQRAGNPVLERTVTADGPLAFLDEVTASLPFDALPGAPYTVTAQIEPGNPDSEPRNDGSADRLPVARDTSTQVRVVPNATLVEPGSVVEASVIVEADGNVPVTDQVTLAAFPYDPETGSPVGSQIQSFSATGPSEITVPPASQRHPSGVEDARLSVPFQRTLDEGAYLLVATFGSATAQAPIGVGAAPPPVVVDRFEDVQLGDTTFGFTSDAGQWSVHPGSDVISSPMTLDPGSREDGAAWVPVENEATLLRPYNDEAVADGSVPLGDQEVETGLLNPLYGVCLLNVGPDCTPRFIGGLTGQDIPTTSEVAEGTIDTATGLTLENEAIVPPEAAVHLESPQGTQRIYGLSHDVSLDGGVSRAELSFISSLFTPPGGTGLTEARAYITTAEDADTLASELNDPENCRSGATCTVERRIAGPLNLLGPLGNAVFNIEEELRCDALPGAFSDVEGVGIKPVTCPDDTSSGSGPGQTGTCQATDQAGEEVCHPTDRARFEVLTALTTGDLVWQDTTANVWEEQAIDLSEYAGQNITLTFIFLAETSHSTVSYETDGLGIDDRTIGYGAPERPKGTFLIDRVTVETDKGLRLSPEDTARAGSAAASTAARIAQENRPGSVSEGWRTMGYLRFTGLPPADQPLRSSAQFLKVDGRPGATGADASSGIALGTRDGQETGVALYPSNYRNPNDNGATYAKPETYRDPALDPAVTVLASPRIDLRGLTDPQLQFDQRFDLNLENSNQPVATEISVSTLVQSLQITVQQAEGCGVGNGQNGNAEVPVTLKKLRCLLGIARQADEDFSVPDQVFVETVSQPRVSAGLYLRARVVTPTGLSDPLPVQPNQGYRYPIGDAGAFEPTLNYTVETPESFPGYTTGPPSSTEPRNQPVFGSELRSRQLGQPVWAGSSDADGDGQPEWVSSTADLSRFAGEVVQLEFVLVARSLGTFEALTNLPYHLDDIAVTEGDVKGQVALEELRWPSQDLRRFAEGEDLPVRLTVTSPTGLDEPVHARAVLFDDEGCLRGDATTSQAFTDDAGRPIDMPPGATLDLPAMIIPGQNVTGVSPWTLQVSTDVGKTPPTIARASILEDPLQGEVVKHPFTGALGVPGPNSQEFTVEASDCDPQPRVVTVPASAGLPQASVTEVEDERFTLSFQADGTIRNRTGEIARGLDKDPHIVAIVEGTDSRASGTAKLVHQGAGDRTALVQPEGPRTPIDTPTSVALRPAIDMAHAVLWAIPLSDEDEEDPEPEDLWRGALANDETREVSIELPATGPYLLVLTGEEQITRSGGQTEDVTVLGGSVIVATETTSAGDPTVFDNVATFKAGEGVTERLTVRDVTVDPPTGLSTDPRRITATVQNTGNTELTGLEVTFTADGDTVRQDTRDRLLPGEIQTFTLPEFLPGGDPSVVLRVTATAGEDLTASAAAPVRSLIDLQALTPTKGDSSQGWQVSGSEASFQDPETNKAPRDTTGSIGLAGANLAGLADVAVSLDHDLDMERQFDGGQIILDGKDRKDVLSAGPNQQEMGPYSPIQGKALTGQRTTPDESVALDTRQFLAGNLLTLVDDTAAEAIGQSVLGSEDQGRSQVTCASRTYADSELPAASGPRCEWSEPIVPVPTEAMRDGVWHLHGGALLSPTGPYNVTVNGQETNVEVNSLTQVLSLEAGPRVVKAAQQSGSLTLSFDEARLLNVQTGKDRLTVQACARFVDLGSPATIGGQQAYTSATDPGGLRCSGLTHGEEQAEELPWSRTVLRFSDIPEGDIDLVRLEFTLQVERTPRGDDGGGILNDETGSQPDVNEGIDRLGLRERFLGWFVGDVQVQAGGVTESWTPDPEALDTTDPQTGLTPDELESVNSAGERFRQVVPQSGYVLAEDVVVDGKQAHNLQGGTSGAGLAMPTTLVPLTACQWWRAPTECAWTQTYDDHVIGTSTSSETRALGSIPQALGLSCWNADAASGVKDWTIEETIFGFDTPASDCDRNYATGLGPQVLSTSLISRLPYGADSDQPRCQGEGDQVIGQPLLWRTRCLHVTRADAEGGDIPEELGDDETVSDYPLLRFTSDDMRREDANDNPVRPDERGRGYGLDYRLILPLDLRFASDRVLVEPIIETPPGALGQRSLENLVQAEVRIAGEETWQPLRFEGTHPTCPTDSRLDENDDCTTLNLTEYRGQEVELALRAQMPHPSLVYRGTSPSAAESQVLFGGLKVEAGYVRMIGLDLGARAFTDTSIEGSGWTINEAKLFGLPIEANVGLDAIDSPLIQPTDGVEDARELHVHVNASGVKESLSMRAPTTVTVYNQGNAPENLNLNAQMVLNGDEVISADRCRVSFDLDGPDGDAPKETLTVDLAPGTSQRIQANLTFEPLKDYDGDNTNDPSACFPGQGPLNVTGTREQGNHRLTVEGPLHVRLFYGDETIPEADYVGSDNELLQPVRANPFFDHGGFLSDPNPEDHKPRIKVEDLRAVPTRPQAGEPVRIQANLSLVDEKQRPVDLELDMARPIDGRDSIERSVGSLDGFQADSPVVTLQPYETRQVTWTLTEPPSNLTLARLTATVSRGIDTLMVNDTAWFSQASLAEHREAFGALDLDGSGDSGTFQSFGPNGSEAYQLTNHQPGQALRATFTTPWVHMPDSPPPVVSVQARWSFPGADDPRDRDPSEPGFKQARSGWAIQVCHAPEPEQGLCPTDNIGGSSQDGEEWAWRTLAIEGTPRNTMGLLNGDLVPASRSPDCGSDQGPTPEDQAQERTEDRQDCSSAAESWTGLQGGEPVITGTNPGFALDRSAEGAYASVLASGTECPERDDAHCPLAWGSQDRDEFVRYRIVAFSTQEQDIEAQLEISDVTLAPVGLDMQIAQSTSGFDIPEAATKAVPVTFHTAGSLGPIVGTEFDAPSGWNVGFERLENGGSVDDGARDRLLIEAPISPSGVSQSALLTPTLTPTEAPLRSAQVIVPVGVQAGLHPDLVVSRVSTPDGIVEGDDVLVEAQIKNVGLSTSPATDVVGFARYQDGTGNPLATDEGEKVARLPSLSPGASATVLLKWTPTQRGEATVRVAADLDEQGPITGALVRPWGGGKIAELLECTTDICNNVGGQRVEVAPPRVADLSVEAEVLADLPLTASEQVDVAIEVTNNGPSTVPAFRARLLVGVISLLQEDPLVVREPLAPGETWRQTVQLVPGNSGNLSLVATAFSEENLVQEARGLRADGTLKEADNVRSLNVPVVARGLDVKLAETAQAKGLTANGQLNVPVGLENLGSDPLVVSVSARAPQGLGTLVDEAGQAGGTVSLEPGASADRQLRVLYDGLPKAGQHTLDVQVASQAGIEKRDVTVEVPAIVNLAVDPATVEARSGKVTIPVTLHGDGNAPVRAQVSIQALILNPVSKTFQVDPGTSRTVNLTTWLTSPVEDVAEGMITVRAGDLTRKAPLRITQPAGPVATLQDTRVVGGNVPKVTTTLNNLGDQATEVNVSLVQDNQTLVSKTQRLSPGTPSQVDLEATPTAGILELVMEDALTGEITRQNLRVDDLRPDLHVLELRTRPLAPQAGETVQVQASLANDGGSPVTFTPGLYVDGTLHTTTAETQRLAPGSVTQVTFEWEATPGQHTLTVDADPLDQVQDRSDEDDARATEVTVQDASATQGATDAVPGLPVGFILVALLAVVWVRRERPE